MRLILTITAFLSFSYALSYHGCTLAPDNMHAWVVCNDSVLVRKTSDFGANWQVQTVPANTKRFLDITCIDSMNAWTCGVLGEILHTSDGGASWNGQVIGLSKYATRIEFYDLNYGWAVCGDGAVGRTTDGGGYWDNIFLPWLFEFYGLSFVDSMSGWIVAGYPDSMLTGQGLIVKTINGGINWDSVYQVSDYKDFFDVHFFNLLEGIVVGGDENDTSALIIRTTNGGLSWNSITAPGGAYYLRAVDFAGNNGWAVGRSGTIIHSSDAGNTWIYQTNPATGTLFDVDFTDSQHGIACGQNIILMTSNGGQTWIETGIGEHDFSNPRLMPLRIWPNPARTFCSIKLELTAGVHEFKIYDVTGKLIRDLPVPSSSSASPGSIIWDRFDNNGIRVPPGVYTIMAGRKNGMSAKIILIE